jgi:hypothetical protein
MSSATLAGAGATSPAATGDATGRARRVGEPPAEPSFRAGATWRERYLAVRGPGVALQRCPGQMPTKRSTTSVVRGG